MCPLVCKQTQHLVLAATDLLIPIQSNSLAKQFCLRDGQTYPRASPQNRVLGQSITRPVRRAALIGHVVEKAGVGVVLCCWTKHRIRAHVNMHVGCPHHLISHAGLPGNTALSNLQSPGTWLLADPYSDPDIYDTDL